MLSEPGGSGRGGSGRGAETWQDRIDVVAADVEFAGETETVYIVFAHANVCARRVDGGNDGRLDWD